MGNCHGELNVMSPGGCEAGSMGQQRAAHSGLWVRERERETKEQGSYAQRLALLGCGLSGWALLWIWYWYGHGATASALAC